jgi:hypothetical protein
MKKRSVSGVNAVDPLVAFKTYGRKEEILFFSSVSVFPPHTIYRFSSVVNIVFLLLQVNHQFDQDMLA